MHTTGTGCSDRGRKRDHNEDRFHVDDELGLYIVSDGMGGHAKGEVASRLAVEAVAREVRHQRALVEAVAHQAAPAEALVQLIEAAVQAAGRLIHDQAGAAPEQTGMGCTLTALVVAGSRAAMAHVGDSRLYLLRDGKLEQLSQDHTYLAEMKRKGLDADEGLAKRFGHILSRALGSQAAVEVDTLAFETVPGDRLLLCSDGITRYVPDEDALVARLAGDDPDLVAEALVGFANESGGADNSTAVVIQVASDDADDEVAQRVRTDCQVKLDALSSVFLFESMSFARISRVLNACEVEVWEAGREVVGQGDRLASLIVVLSGELELTRGSEVIGLVRAGEEVGATSLARPRTARAGLQSRERTKLLRLKRSRFRDLAQARPGLGLALLERLALRLGDDLDAALAVAAQTPGDADPGLL